MSQDIPQDPVHVISPPSCVYEHTIIINTPHSLTALSAILLSNRLHPVELSSRGPTKKIVFASYELHPPVIRIIRNHRHAYFKATVSTVSPPSFADTSSQ